MNQSIGSVLVLDWFNGLLNFFFLWSLFFGFMVQSGSEGCSINGLIGWTIPIGPIFETLVLTLSVWSQVANQLTYHVM